MPTFPKNLLRGLAATMLCCAAAPAMASHLIGDEFTYRHIGDSISSTTVFHKYEVTLNIYEDCLTGEPQAIAEDNPAFFSLFNGSTRVSFDTGVLYTSAVSIPILTLGPCGGGSAPLCIIRKTFVKVYALPVSTSAYTIAYQRCCKNATLTNVIDPGNTGSTYYCTIPASTVAAHNTSAVFTDYPPEIIALNEPFTFDHSATDADGDSLSYELCNAYVGASSTDVKPIPVSPTYTGVSYTPPLSYSDPMSCSVPLQIDPVTGVLSGTPNRIGRYLINVCCHEWRGGVLVNTSSREFQFSVISFAGTIYHPFAGNDTAIYVGDSLQFNASGALTYSWSPATYLSSTTIPDPVGHFSVAGIFPYVLHGISDSGCTGNDTINVTVLAHSEFTAPNAFTPNGDGINDNFGPIPVKGSYLINMKVYNNTGLLLFTTNNLFDTWDGTYKGTKLPMGVYLYKIMYTDNKGATRYTTGNVTLIR